MTSSPRQELQKFAKAIIDLIESGQTVILNYESPVTGGVTQVTLIPQTNASYSYTDRTLKAEMFVSGARYVQVPTVIALQNVRSFTVKSAEDQQ